MAKRKSYLFVCINRRPDGTPKGSCAARGAEEVHRQLKEGLKARGLAEVTARACTASCLDVCWVGPAIFVSQDDGGRPPYAYGRVTAQDIPEILDALAEDRRVERLLLSEEDFVEPREKKQPSV